MVYAKLPPLDLLRQLMEYNPDTGVLTWRARTVDLFKTNLDALAWNGRYGGKEAFTTVSKWGHRGGKVAKRRYVAHRIAWKIYYGEDPSSDIDHINGDPADNRICNLRLVTPLENMRNMRMQKHNKSGAFGVRFRERDNRWYASIGGSKRRVHLGTYLTFEEALSARRAAEVELGYHPNHGRIGAVSDGGA